MITKVVLVVVAISYLAMVSSHAIAMYGALKFNEVFGASAMVYPVEEFCHSPLFSIKETDQAIVLGDDDDNNRKLSKRLNEEGFSSVHVRFKNTGIELLPTSHIFYTAPCAQTGAKIRPDQLSFSK